MSELKKYQHVKVTRERGTQEDALVLGLLATGDVLVEIDGQAQIVSREDVQS